MLTTPEAEAPAPARLGRGPRAFLACLLLVAAWTATSRHLDPIGEGFTPMAPGGADLRYPYNGARALLAGVNPYRHDLPWLFDPWGRDVEIRGVMFRQFYPPSHFVFDVPLVIASGANPRAATRMFFFVNLAALACVAWGVIALARRHGGVPGGDLPALLAGLVALALAASRGGALLLERGQSDLILGLSTWGGALLCLRGRAAVGTFLLSIGVLCKGYAVLAGGGVLLLALLDRRTRRDAALGVVAAAVVLLLPVARFIPDGIEATRLRADAFATAAWYDHSFGNFARSFAPSLEAPIRVGLELAALLASALCFAGALRTRQPGPDEPAQAAHLLWTTLFMSCALVATIGWSSVSCAYNLFHILPGVLLLGLLQGRLPTSARWPRATSHLLVATILCLTLVRGYSLAFPVAALGLCGVVLLGLLCGGVALARPAPPPSPPEVPLHA